MRTCQHQTVLVLEQLPEPWALEENGSGGKSYIFRDDPGLTGIYRLKHKPLAGASKHCLYPVVALVLIPLILNFDRLYPESQIPILSLDLHKFACLYSPFTEHNCEPQI